MKEVECDFDKKARCSSALTRFSNDSDLEDLMLASTVKTGHISRKNLTKPTSPGEFSHFRLKSCQSTADYQLKMPRKSEDQRKRQNFFYQTLNDAKKSYTPTMNNLFATNLMAPRSSAQIDLEIKHSLARKQVKRP